MTIYMTSIHINSITWWIIQWYPRSEIRKDSMIEEDSY